jgi:hypothetical protein
VRPFLSEVTRNKIFVLSSPNDLLLHFDVKMLHPDIYSALSGDAEKDVQVAARAIETVQVWIAEGQEVSLAWRLQSSRLHRSTDVDFSAVFMRDAFEPGGKECPITHDAGTGIDDAKVDVEIAASQITTIDSRSADASDGPWHLDFTAPGGGALTLTWDNSKSVIRAKTVSYRLTMADGSG